MHETRFIQQIFTALKQNKDQATDAKKIVVNVRLSPFSHVTPETLKGSFRELSKGKGFKNVSLKVLPLELPLECRSCKAKTKITERVFACPSCASADVQIGMDQEFFVESLEIERK